MVQSSRIKFATLIVALACASASFAQESSWPQWRGPQRDGKSTETGLLTAWPEGGPRRLWLFEDCGVGFGGPAVIDGRLYIMAARDGQDYLLCLDANRGRELWATSMGEIFRHEDFADGSRGTPTVVGGNVYTLSGAGTLICVRAGDGREVWRQKLPDFGGVVPRWGYCESVLVDDDRVLCTPGGKQGAIAAFDKSSGRLLWQAKEITDEAHYSSIVRAEFHGRPQYVQLMEKRLVSVSPEDGKLLWEAPFPGGNIAVIPTPVVHGNKVLATAGYGAGCILVEIAADNTAKVVYDNNIMKNHHGGVVLVGEHVYGHSDDVGWICMNFSTGRRIWRDEESFDKGALTYADGLFYCLGESDGEGEADVALVEPSTEGWKERSRFKLSPRSQNRKTYDRVWTHPVIAGGKLYLRDQEKLYCYDVKAL